jgi:hypothetical protein
VDDGKSRAESGLDEVKMEPIGGFGRFGRQWLLLESEVQGTLDRTRGNRVQESA